MAHTFPLTLPASMVAAHRVDLTAKPAEGLRVAVFDVAAAPSGETYVLYGARRYRTSIPSVDDPAERNFTYGIISRYAPDGSPSDTALFAQPHPDGSPSAIPEAGDMTLAILPD